MAENKIDDLLNEGTLGDKFSNFLKNNASTLVLVIMSAFYISMAYLKVIPNEDVVNVTIMSVLGLVINFLTRTILGHKGYEKAMASKTIKQTLEEYENQVESNSENSEYYPAYCEIIYEEKIRKYQTQILTSVNLKYSEFINGEYDNNKTHKNIRGEDVKFTKRQLKVLKKAKEPKIIFITPEYLTSETTIDVLKEKKEISAESFETKRSVSSLLSMILTTVIFSFFTAEAVMGKSLIAIIWNALQVCVYILFGILEYSKRYNWVMTYYRNRIKKRIDLLIRFKNMFNNKNDVLFKKIEEMKGENNYGEQRCEQL